MHRSREISSLSWDFLSANLWPTDPRPQEICRWPLTNQYKGLRGMCWKILRSYGMKTDEFEEIIRLALSDIRDIRWHFYLPR